MDELAEQLDTIRGTWGGEAIWPYWGTGSLGHLQGMRGPAGQRLWNVLGASEHRMTICSVAGTEGVKLATGTKQGIDPESLAHARLILLWGVNTLTTGHHLWRFIKEAQQNGAHVVAIDPVLSRTGKQSDEHVAPLPGTDGALVLGLLHVVLDLGLEDRDYLAEHTLGWPEFRERVLEFPPPGRPPSPGCRSGRSANSASGSPGPGRPRSARAWACSGTRAAAPRCACSPACPG